MIHHFSLPPQQDSKPAVSIARLLMSKMRQLLFQLVVLFLVGPVSVTRPGYMRQLAGFALSGGEPFDEMRRVRAPIYELKPFFISRDFSISLSRASSATNFFRRPFSSSR